MNATEIPVTGTPAYWTAQREGVALVRDWQQTVADPEQELDLLRRIAAHGVATRIMHAHGRPIERWIAILETMAELFEAEDADTAEKADPDAPPHGLDWCRRGCQPLYGMECGMCGYDGPGVWIGQTDTVAEYCCHCRARTYQSPDGICERCGKDAEGADDADAPACPPPSRRPDSDMAPCSRADGAARRAAPAQDTMAMPRPRPAPSTEDVEMSNVGDTVIEAFGPPQDRAALLAHVRETARDGSPFTLSGLTGLNPTWDQLVCWATLEETVGRVSLSISITDDRDCFYVAECLAKRFPALRIVGTFVAECDESAFSAICFIGGERAYAAQFGNDICCDMPAGGPEGECWLVRFFERTPGRSAAALDHIITTPLGGLVHQPSVAGAWRRATLDGMEPQLWWRPGATDGDSQVLAAQDSEFILLHQVDAWGGYARKERLDAEAAAAQLLELAGEIERCRPEHAAGPDTQAQAVDPFAGFDDVAF